MSEDEIKIEIIYFSIFFFEISDVGGRKQILFSHIRCNSN